MKNRKYLVTGATGFLGGTICRQLIEQGESVRAFALPNDKAIQFIPEGVEICEGDLCDMEALERFFTVEEGIDSLIKEVQRLNTELNIPKSFQEAGIAENEFLAKVDLLADRAFEDQCTTVNPRVPLVSEIKQILLDSYYGKEV